MIEKIETITASRKNMTMFAVLAALSLLTLAVLFPHPAYAFGLDSLEDWLGGIMKDYAEGLLNSSISLMNLFGMDDSLTAPFSQLLSPGKGDSSTYNVIMGIQSVVKTLGQSILAFALLLQLVKISQRIDGSQTLPVVKEIGLMALYFFAFSYLVNHSFDICSAAYGEINNIINDLWDGQTRGSVTEAHFDDTTNMTLVAGIQMVSIMLFMWLTTLISCVVAYAMIFARAIQLYIMAACAPIPFSLLAFEETRQMGVGFCKNFIAVALAGLIISCLILIYPGLIMEILKSTAGISLVSGKYVINVGSVILALVPIIGVSFMYVFALIKSGSWARDILGG